MDLDQNADFNKSFRINFDVFWGKYIKEGFSCIILLPSWFFITLIKFISDGHSMFNLIDVLNLTI